MSDRIFTVPGIVSGIDLNTTDQRYEVSGTSDALAATLPGLYAPSGTTFAMGSGLILDANNLTSVAAGYGIIAGATVEIDDSALDARYSLSGNYQPSGNYALSGAYVTSSGSWEISGSTDALAITLPALYAASGTPTSFMALTDVSGTYSSGQLATWDGAVWVPTSNIFFALSDVSGVYTSGQLAVWNGVNWVPATNNWFGLIDVSGTWSSGQLSVWDGTYWTAVNNNLDDLSDVDVSGRNIGDRLAWNGNQWIPSPVQSVVGAAQTLYLSSEISFGDSETLSLSPALIEDSESVTISGVGAFARLDRFISSPLGRQSLDAGKWDFHIYASTNSNDQPDWIHVKIGVREDDHVIGLSGVLVGTTLTLSSGIITSGMCNTDIRQSSFVVLSGTKHLALAQYISPSGAIVQIEDQPDAGWLPVDAIYRMLFNGPAPNMDNIGTYDLNFSLAEPEFAIAPGDELIAAFYAVTSGSTPRTITMFYGGERTFSSLNTPLLSVHNDLAGLNDGNYIHLTATEYSTFLAMPISGTSYTKTEASGLLAGQLAILPTLYQASGLYQVSGTSYTKSEASGLLAAQILLLSGTSYTKGETDSRYELSGSAIEALSGSSYTKAESDARYEASGLDTVYETSGTSAALDAGLPARFQASGNYQAAGNYQPSGNYQVSGNYITSSGNWEISGSASGLAAILPSLYAASGHTHPDIDTVYETSGTSEALANSLPALYQASGLYEVSGTSHTKQEADTRFEVSGTSSSLDAGLPARFQASGNYQPAGNYQVSGDYITSSGNWEISGTSDALAATLPALYQASGNYQSAGNYALSGEYITSSGNWEISGTSASLDAGLPARFQASGNYLTSDDDTPYTKVDGSRAFTNPISGVDPIVSGHLATKNYIDTLAGGLSALVNLYMTSGGSQFDGIMQAAYPSPAEVFSTPIDSSGIRQEVFRFTTPSGSPKLVSLAPGTYASHIHASHTIGNKSVFLQWELWISGGTSGILTSDWSDNLALADSPHSILGVLPNRVALNLNDRLQLRFYAAVSGGGQSTTIEICCGPHGDSYFPLRVLDQSSIYQASGLYEVSGTSFTKAESDIRYAWSGTGGVASSGSWEISGSSEALAATLPALYAASGFRPALTELSNVSGIWTSGEHMVYDGTNFIPIGNNLSDLTDVSILNPNTNDKLSWNGLVWTAEPSTTTVGVGVVSFYLDPTATVADNLALSPTFSVFPETEVGAVVSGSTNVSFIERFVSPALGITNMPAGQWDFTTYARCSNISGTNTIHIRINHRQVLSGVTGTWSGAGQFRNFNASSGVFVPSDADGDILLATLVETPSQTGWISGYISASGVIVHITDVGYVNESGVSLSALYKLIVSGHATPITNVEGVDPIQRYHTQAIKPTDTPFELGDGLVAAYFAETTSPYPVTIDLYYGGNTNFSYFSTPQLLKHNDLAGLNEGNYLHMTAAERVTFLAMPVSGTSYTKTEASGLLAAQLSLLPGIYQASGLYQTSGTAYTKAEADARYELSGTESVVSSGNWEISGTSAALAATLPGLYQASGSYQPTGNYITSSGSWEISGTSAALASTLPSLYSASGHTHPDVDITTFVGLTDVSGVWNSGNLVSYNGSKFVPTTDLDVVYETSGTSAALNAGLPARFQASGLYVSSGTSYTKAEEDARYESSGFLHPYATLTDVSGTFASGQIARYNGAKWIAATFPASSPNVQSYKAAAGSTWTKPTDQQYAFVKVQVWAGGGGGGRAAANTAGGGGGGGAYNEYIYPYSQVQSTLTVVVGSGGTGGAADGNAGGTGGQSSVSGTSVGLGLDGVWVTAFGGGGGGGTATPWGGGGGGGQTGAGVAGASNPGAGGTPGGGAVATATVPGGNSLAGGGGGGNTAAVAFGGSSLYGGGGGGGGTTTTTQSAGGSSQWGGGGGGGANDTGTPGGAGGTSTYGGAGATGGANGGAPGSATAPGGGGGGAEGPNAGGNGAIGWVIITAW